MNEEEVAILTGLGLAPTRARVYLALCHSGILDIRAISDITGIARQDIYRITSDLIKMGLIEKIICRPIAFRAIPIEEGFSFLLGQRQKKLSALESKAKKLLDNFAASNERRGIEKSLLSQFVLIPSKDAVVHRLRKAIEKTQISIDVSTTWKRFRFACFQLGEALEKAWRRGVNCRAVVGEPEEPIFDFLKAHWKSPYAKIKYTRSIPKTVMAIYDKKEVFIYVEPTADLTESPALWSNNPSVIAMAEDCFEMLWITALEKPEYHINGEKL